MNEEQSVQTLELVEALVAIGERLEALCADLEKIRAFVKGGYGENFELNEIRVLLLRSLSYGDYLKTKYWKNRRQKALSKTNQCALCGHSSYYSGGTTLEVHHRSYDNLGEEKDDDLVVLCHNCHSKFHEPKVVKSLPPARDMKH